MKYFVILTTLIFCSVSYANTCITKSEALEIARANIESYNDSIDDLREPEINLEDVINDMEFNGFTYQYVSNVSTYTIEDIEVTCAGKFTITYYRED